MTAPRMFSAAGALLFILSLPCLAVMGREAWADRQARRQFTVTRTWTQAPNFSAEAIEDSLGTTEVALRDRYFGKHHGEDARVIATVQVLVNGREVGAPFDAEVRPHYLDANRYHGWANLVRLHNNRTGETSIAVVQRIAPKPTTSQWNAPPEGDLAFRIIFVSPEGHIREDQFAYAERAVPRYRSLLANYASPYALGYYSEVLQMWPTLLFPIIYPLGTCAAGVLLLVITPVVRRLFRWQVA